MSIPINNTMEPRNNGSFPIVYAKDVEMPDGTRLSDFKGGVTSVNGQTGDVNITAVNGKDGADGADGVSPIATVTQITGGHKVTIRDAEGSKSFNVMDGAQGIQGEKGDKGDTGAQGEPGAKGDKGDPGDSASITVDSALDPNSTNPVQNKVVTAYFNEAVQTLGQLQDSIPAIDPDLTKEGQAADAKAVGNAFAQAYEDIGAELQALGRAIPTEAQINALIDAKLGVIENGSY